MMYTRAGRFLFLFVFAIALATPLASAGEMPKNWPWHGVTVNNLSFFPARLATLKKKLPGMNSIRLTLLPTLTAKREHATADQAWISMVKWTNQMLDQCAKYGVEAVITIQNIPVAGSLGPGVTQANPRFWSSAAQRDAILKYVARMAREFSTRGDELAAFEVISEPKLRAFGHVELPKEWPELMRRIVRTIRQYSDKWIVVTPGVGGKPQGYKGFRPLDDNRIIYGAHMYEPYPYTLQGIDGRMIGLRYPGNINGVYWDRARLTAALRPLRQFQDKYDVPVWLGEFSAARWAKGSGRYLLDVVNLCDEYGWGWAYFNIGGFNAWDPDYGPAYTPRSPVKEGDQSPRWKTLVKMFSAADATTATRSVGGLAGTARANAGSTAGG